MVLPSSAAWRVIAVSVASRLFPRPCATGGGGFGLVTGLFSTPDTTGTDSHSP